VQLATAAVLPSLPAPTAAAPAAPPPAAAGPVAAAAPAPPPPRERGIVERLMRSLWAAQMDPVAVQAGMTVHLGACFLVAISEWPEGKKVKADMAPMLEGLMAGGQQRGCRGRCGRCWNRWGGGQRPCRVWKADELSHFLRSSPCPPPPPAWLLAVCTTPIPPSPPLAAPIPAAWGGNNLFQQ
jgi:hypothetical protein